VKDIIVFKNILKKFPGVIALDNVNLSIRKGEIHAIVGENGAGKSTLMNILGGEIHPDRGEVFYKEKPVFISNPSSARSVGISIVHQELKLCPNLTVMENIFLGREERNRWGRINWVKMGIKSKEVLESLGTNINPKTIVRDLSIAQQQIVEIAKAISLNLDVLIMDEPTSSLTFSETERLFENLKKLKKNDVTIIFISHRLEEVFKISDRISVLRDGKYLGTYKTNEASIDSIVTLIAGKKLVNELSHKMEIIEGAKVALEVKSFSRGRFFYDINFKLFQGEILGLYGLQGAGRTELVETLFGLEKQDSGKIFSFGKQLCIKSTSDAIKYGIAMIPEDRRKTGLFLNMDIKDNICVANTKEVSIFGFIVSRNVFRVAKEFVKKMEIKLTGLTQKVKNLSGGNQQKVIISRWLATSPKIFLMDELTRGIDVGSKAEIYKVLRKLRKEGASILLVSSELPEIVAECDTIIVMCNARLTGNIPQEYATKEKIISCAMKF